MAKVGYIRIRCDETDGSYQLKGLELDTVYEERISSYCAVRPEFEKCLANLQENDTLYVESFARIARNNIELYDILCRIVFLKKANFVSRAEKFSIEQGDEQIIKAKLDCISYMAKFEKDLNRERQQDGIEKAKQKGKHLGRPQKLTDDEKKDITDKIRSGESVYKVAKEYNISWSSVYKIVGKKNNTSETDADGSI